MSATIENHSENVTQKKKAYHHGDLRRAIITEATARARVHGEKAIVLREIAAEIGVSATAAYRHFTNRQQLVEEVAAKGYETMTEALRVEPVAGADADPGRAAYLDLRNACVALLEFSSAERAWSRMMLENLGTAAVVAEAAGPARDTLQVIVDRGAEVGVFRPGTDLADDKVFWAGIDGLGTLLIFNVYPGTDLEEVLGDAAGRVLDLALDAVLTDAGRAIAEERRRPARIVTDVASDRG